MFALGLETSGVFTLIQNGKGHVYTWPLEGIAREFFEVAKCEAHLYQFEIDLSIGRLVERSNTTVGSPDEVYPTESQKMALFKSFVYPSLLEWTPLEQTLEVSV